jgi:subtilisin family serine protease
MGPFALKRQAKLQLVLIAALALATGIPDAPAQAPSAAPQLPRGRFNLPAPGETRFVPNEVILDSFPTVSTPTLEAIAQRHSMTRMETQTFRLTGRRMHRWRLDGGGSVEAMIRALVSEQLIAGAQPNYLYSLAESAADRLNSDQYAPKKLNLTEAHKLSTGNRILVAVIDSGVDASHPDLVGAITANFDAMTDDLDPHSHGTGMAGAIAARRTLQSVAPQVGLLTVRAFSLKASGQEATTFNILRGLDWAAEKGARVVNMSFTGPPDPRIKAALLKAAGKGLVLVAAAGNAGPNSPPLHPAAYPNVIAVTATDDEDVLFARANRGDYIAVAAPGVDVLVPGLNGTYQLTTGTSVAAAEVSGVAALLIERNPALKPGDIRRILMRTAKDLGPKGRDREFGAGLVNAFQAVRAAR